MQHLLSRARCDDQAMLDSAADWAVEQLNGGQGGDRGDAILIVDETSDVKSSADCAGRFILTYPMLGQRPVITPLATSLSQSSAWVYFSGGN